MSDLKTTPTGTSLKIAPPESSNGELQIYATSYKKGPIMGHLHFKHSGTFMEAVEAVKIYLSNKSLKHVHTVPFLVDISQVNSESD